MHFSSCGVRSDTLRLGRLGARAQLFVFPLPSTTAAAGSRPAFPYAERSFALISTAFPWAFLYRLGLEKRAEDAAIQP